MPPCKSRTVAALKFPRVAGDQVSIQLTMLAPPLPPTPSDLIALRVTGSAVLFVASIGPPAGQAASFEAFVRKAYARAKATLG